MEAIFVYSLVFIFFIAFSLLASLVLMNHPYTEPQADQAATTARVDTTKPGGYIAVAILLAFLLILSFVSGKKRTDASQG